MRYHLADGLVIRQYARRWRVNSHLDLAPINLDRVAKPNALPNVCRFTVDGNSPFQNEGFHLEARAHACLRQHFVQLGAVHLWHQHTFWGGGWICDDRLRCLIKGATDHVLKTDIGRRAGLRRRNPRGLG